MSLYCLLSEFSSYIKSSQFLELARHPEHARAFTRERKLPLPSLVAVMLSGMRKSIQAELDEFFAHLDQQAQLVRDVSDRAFRRARAKLSAAALPALNDWLLLQAGAAGLVSTWHGLRLVAAGAASANQIAFGLYLPGAEMMLAASLHSVHENERQMLFQHIDRLSSSDLLLMDRGYPCRWLVALLNERGIPFCMRVEKDGDAGFACVRDFLRSGLDEQLVVLRSPDKRDAADYECPATPQKVRLIRHVASTGKVRVLMTNLFDTDAFPGAVFGEIYHQRWRIEEAFKRLKHRLNLEHVSGLSQLAAMQDFAAKILCDNLQALISADSASAVKLPPHRRINHAYAHTVLKPLLPALLLGRLAAEAFDRARALIARHTCHHQPGKSKPRPKQTKPHRHMSQKPC